MYYGLLIETTTSKPSIMHMKLNSLFSDISFKSLTLYETHIESLLYSAHLYSIIIINTKAITTELIHLCKKIRVYSSIPIILFSKKFEFQMMKEAAQYHINDVLTGTILDEDIKKSVYSSITAVSSTDKQEQVFGSSHKTSSKTECVIEKVKLFVNRELHKQITLKQISKELHFNYAYLGQKFKNKLNISFNEYLLQQRMEKAKVLLLETDLKIYEIAQNVGYTEIDWFYKKFKEYTGISANEYRKQYVYSYAF